METFFTEPGFFSEEVIALFKKTVIIHANWKWMVLLSALILGYLLRPLIQFLLKKGKENLVLLQKHPNSIWAYFCKQQAERPLAWVLVIGLWFVAGEAAEIKGNFAKYYGHLLNGLLAIHIIRLIYFAVDALGYVMMERASKTSSTFDDQLAAFTKKSLKVVVVILGALIVMQSFGLNVMSLLAGLGLGGLALALAAQDTAANVFGSITILFDQPFKIGDQIKVGSAEGTVEEIGFRSTRVRTPYNSLISLPNSLVAKETIDNMGVRPARRIRQNLGIAYETPTEKIIQFCDSVRYLLLQNSKVRKEGLIVTFNGFGDSSLNVLVNLHAEVSTLEEEVELQQAIFIEIIKIAEQMSVEFAYPTRTVYHRGLLEQLGGVSSPGGN